MPISHIRSHGKRRKKENCQRGSGAPQQPFLCNRSCAAAPVQPLLCSRFPAAVCTPCKTCLTWNKFAHEAQGYSPHPTDPNILFALAELFPFVFPTSGCNNSHEQKTWMGTKAITQHEDKKRVIVSMWLWFYIGRALRGDGITMGKND
ncbi:hypothetical protein POVWA2_031450 [Plasmodium ovale wallikeri]|uniref:Uncharacterized protein n=1 Tax=Plasmodium ovale wallikeri TaxID=864142 RepID=A0A1A8YXM3_PLAOA|nr:hypothetical protein POVWA1_031730 [Plasmodium ovale wallikeri]SBT36699.1 hypothetical protein POVWA2_031450 [Plasmodium ovale wallikeri]